MSGSGDLRDYQEEALEAINDVRDSNKSLVMPTGSGKTRVALKYADELTQSGKSVAYITATNAHAEQVLREASEIDVSAEHIRGARAHEESDATQSRERLLEDYDLGFHTGVFSYNGYFLGSGVTTADTLIIDDAHGIIGQNLSYASVSINRNKWSGEFGDVVEMIKENNPLLADHIDGLQYPVHREGQSVLVPPPSTEETAEALKEKLRTLSDGTGYHRTLLRDRLQSSTEFVQWPCVVSRDTISWRPFVLPFESFGQPQESERAEEEVLLLTSTKESEEFLQYRLGLSEDISSADLDAEVEEMGTRLVIPYPDLGSYSPPSIAQLNIIEQWARKFGSVLVSVSSNRAHARLSDSIDTDITTLRYQSDRSIEEFEGLQEPRVLILVNRPSGIDIHSEVCNVGIHLDLPYSTSGHESLAGDFKLPGTVAEASLAVRLSQLLGRLNRHPEDRSAHLILAGELPMARGSVFVESLDPAALLDILIGRRGIKPEYGLPNEETLLEEVHSFLSGDDELRESHVQNQERARERYLQGGMDRFSPDANQVIEANLLESRGNFSEAARNFESLARSADQGGFEAEASFFDFQALCCSFANDVDSQDIFGRDQDALIERALNRNPANTALVAALRQAQLGSDSGTEESQEQLTEMELKRQGYLHYQHNQDKYDEANPSGDLSNPEDWTDYWRNRLTAADHEELLDAYIDAFRLLGTDTPHREIQNNDASVQWSTEPGTRYTIALEVKGWNDDLRDSPSELKVDHLTQARDNAQNIDANAVLLVSSRTGHEREVPRRADELDVSYITNDSGIALADVLAHQCATFHRISEGAAGMSDIPIDVLFISSILQSDRGTEINPAQIREAIEE